MTEIATTTASASPFFGVMCIIIAVGAIVTAFFFRNGGIYNKEPFDDNEEMPSLDREPEELPFVPASVPSPSSPILPVEPVITESGAKPSLEEICTYMRDFEGKPGDANYRNNNPLNCKFYDPKQTGTDKEYLPKYRPVKCSPSGFAIFKDSTTGWNYGVAMIRNKIRNHPKYIEK